MTRRRIVVLGLGLVAGIGVTAFVAGARWLEKPFRRAAGPPPSDLRVEDVTIPSDSGSELRGWFVSPDAAAGARPRGAILLLHGIRSSRAPMVPRARFLARAGYASLLIDFQSEGESPGERITFGLLEARDAEAGLAWLHDRLPDAPLGAIGVSMGGAALVLAESRPPLAAVVLESVYPTIAQATARRLRRVLGPPGAWIAPLLAVPLRWRFGLSRDDLRPIEHVADLRCPLLLIQGTDDLLTTKAEGRELFDRALEPKELWEVEHAGHCDFSAFAPEAYEKRVLAFLDAAVGSTER
jgi:fermentation-respiration switch protein FrsA (DUF1100 family)